MTGGFNKQVFSTFTGRASPIEDTKAKKITASARRLRVRLRHAQGSGEPLHARQPSAPCCEALICRSTSSRAIAFLNGRKMVSIELAKTGDSEIASRSAVRVRARGSQREGVEASSSDNTTS